MGGGEALTRRSDERHTYSASKRGGGANKEGGGMS